MYIHLLNNALGLILYETINSSGEEGWNAQQSVGFRQKDLWVAYPVRKKPRHL